MEIRTLLGTHFPSLKDTDLITQIERYGTFVEVDSGAEILKEGAYVKVIPLLVSGLVKVVKQERGKEMLLYHIYPAESCIVSIQCGLSNTKSDVRAIAEDRSSALLLPSQYLAEWKRKYPSFNEFIMTLYQKRFYNLLDAFNALAFQRLDMRLISLIQSKRDALNTQRLEMTHQELAEELGVARESVSRVMKKLEAEKKVVLHRGWIEVV